jgi:RHS repeat-associated protein
VGALIRGADDPPRPRRAAHYLVTVGFLILVAVMVPASAWAQSGQIVEYYHLDALGSVRVVTDQNAQVVSRHDFLPFGEEWNPPANAKEKKLFTGHERDADIGLDYFGARYYRPQVGRFTTVDPGQASATVDDPQSWNAYAYARNNPLRFVDPDGRRWFTKNCNAMWVEPNPDGTYTSPGEGWVAHNQADYNNVLDVAFVDGELSFIGETRNGRKILTPWFPDPPVEDATFSLAASLWGVGAALRGGAAAIATGIRGPSLAGQLRFTGTAVKSLSKAGRHVPLQTVAEAIKHGTRMPDPQGVVGAVKIVQQVFVNGKPKTLEIIYQEATKTVLHVLYK